MREGGAFIPSCLSPPGAMECAVARLVDFEANGGNYAQVTLGGSTVDCSVGAPWRR